MVSGIDYTEDEWHISAAHYPLSTRPKSDLLLLHRHWMWANQQCERFFELLAKVSVETFQPGPAMMATKEMGSMFVWYGLLWSVVEACIVPAEGREIAIRGPFREDIDRMSDILRRCRNAVLHVPRSGELLDDRIAQLVAEQGSPDVLRRIHRGFGRLFIEEFKRLGAPVPDRVVPPPL